MRRISAALAIAALAPAAALATVPGEVVINEAMIVGVGTDNQEFVELKGPANHDLSDLELVFFNGSNGASYDTISLAGQTIPADGYFVIAGSAANVPTADLVDGPATNWLQNGDPDAITLRRTADQVTIDSVAYFALHNVGVADDGNLTTPTLEGDLTGLGGDDVWPVQTGTGARDATGVLGESNVNASIGRFPDGVDTNNNYNDFSTLFTRTPGASNNTTARLFGTITEDFSQATGLSQIWSPSFTPMILETAGGTGITPSPDPTTPNEWVSVKDNTGGGDGAGIIGIGQDYAVTVFAYNATTTATTEYSGVLARLNILQNNTSFNFDQDFDNDGDFGSAYGDAYYGITMNMTNDTAQAYKVYKGIRTAVGAPVAVTDATWAKLEIICDGGDVDFEVNDSLIGSLTGEPVRAGYVALGYYESQTPGTGLVRAHFDGLSIVTENLASVADWSVLE